MYVHTVGIQREMEESQKEWNSRMGEQNTEEDALTIQQRMEKISAILLKISMLFIFWFN